MSNEVYIPGNGFYPDANQSYYGAYRTRTFSNIFSSYNIFAEQYLKNPLRIEFNEAFTLEQLYFMLYAHYGNSHIAFTDENQFKYYLYSIIYQYGPRVVKKREIQIRLTELDKDAAKIGGKAIYNHSYNPSTAPSTSTLEELQTINDQNVTNYLKSDLEAYAALNTVLEEDVVDDFIHKFKRLFIKVLAPDYPLLYESNPESYIIGGE